MARPKSSRPTDTELAILNVLWQSRSGLSIRQITQELQKSKTSSTYATIQTLVRIMEKKGLLQRGEERYPAIYRPVAEADDAKGHLVNDFLDRVFGGSIKQLLTHALPGKISSKRALQRIQKIVDEMEE